MNRKKVRNDRPWLNYVRRLIRFRVWTNIGRAGGHPFFLSYVCPVFKAGRTLHGYGWRMLYGRCGRCHTNFARATPTLCPFIIISHTNFDLLVNHIMFWPHQLWKPSSAHDYSHSVRDTSDVAATFSEKAELDQLFMESLGDIADVARQTPVVCGRLHSSVCFYISSFLSTHVFIYLSRISSRLELDKQTTTRNRNSRNSQFIIHSKIGWTRVLDGSLPKSRLHTSHMNDVIHALHQSRAVSILHQRTYCKIFCVRQYAIKKSWLNMQQSVTVLFFNISKVSSQTAKCGLGHTSGSVMTHSHVIDRQPAPVCRLLLDCWDFVNVRQKLVNACRNRGCTVRSQDSVGWWQSIHNRCPVRLSKRLGYLGEFRIVSIEQVAGVARTPFPKDFYLYPWHRFSQAVCCIYHTADRVMGNCLICNWWYQTDMIWNWCLLFQTPHDILMRLYVVCWMKSLYLSWCPVQICPWWAMCCYTRPLWINGGGRVTVL